MAATPELQSVLVFERDLSDELLLVWVYPKVTDTYKNFLTSKCSIISTEADEKPVSFIYGQYKKLWYYIKRFPSTYSEKVKDVYFAVCCQNFNPELYSCFIDTFGVDYKGNTTIVLSNYLSLFTKGYCLKDDTKQLSVNEYDVKKAYLNVNFKELLVDFGMEIILIYTGLLLKKRIIVYSPKKDILVNTCRALPCFVFHRLNWNIVFPYVEISEDELAQFKSQRTYVAGFTDASIENRTDLYDLFVNVQDREITINPDSKEYFHMGKMHKELAKFLMQEAGNEDATDQTIIKDLTKKTLDILSNLKSLDAENTDNPKISLALLQSRSFTSVMQSFLYNLASAEGLVTI